MVQRNNNRTLLVMDVQNATVARLSDSTQLINSLTKVIHTSRNHKIPVIFIVVGFRKGYPEVSPNNKSFSLLKNGTMNFDSEDGAKVHSAIMPLSDDLVVIKKRVSAFTGSDLELVLRSLEIKHLILTGIATGGVVLSTLREAADKDYTITVLSD